MILPSQLADSELLQKLKNLVVSERHMRLEILYYLREVEARKIYLARGYPDIYRFAKVELGYSSGAAYRRVSAMRLLTALPELEKNMKSGELLLETASLAQSAFRKENLRRREEKEVPLTLDEKREITSALMGQSTREAGAILLERLPKTAEMGVEKARRVAGGKTEVQFVASRELMAKLDELKGLLAHQNFEGRMDALIEKLADIALKKLKPAPSQSPTPTPTQAEACKTPAPGKTETVGKRSRYIRVAEVRKVFKRDYEQGCSFKDAETGRICGSRHGLQKDHRVPFCQGGSNEAENLFLVCGGHNRYRAEKMGIGRADGNGGRRFVGT